MAKLLEKELLNIPLVRIAYSVEANGVFARIPRHAIAKIKKLYFFYVWDEEQNMARWMCSFDTTEQDVKQFAKFVAETINP
jgi:threonine aldolase